MILPDVNLLLYAHREEFPRHDEYRIWLEDMMARVEPFALAGVILSGFVRIATNPRLFDPPSTMKQALEFVAILRSQPNCVWLTADRTHWAVFEALCGEPGIKAGLVTDAYVAALAIRHGCDLATEDGDFKRFLPRLSIRRPLSD
ncbi:MAG: type II toxin-antitoxin system VapC family toxin [Bradymonadales bacterium]|nr:type II toxin-antitoxin system VapC family toxin [Bradymonadales bacterium]